MIYHYFLFLSIVTGNMLNFQDLSEDRHGRQDSEFDHLGKHLEQSLQMSDEEDDNTRVRPTSV